MEITSRHTVIEPKREIQTNILNFSGHKEILQQFFDQQGSESLNPKEKQLFVDKLKKSLAS